MWLIKSRFCVVRQFDLPTQFAQLCKQFFVTYDAMGCHCILPPCRFSSKCYVLLNFERRLETLATRMERVYRQACAWRLWWLVRFCAAKLRKTMNSLAPGITDMLVRGKQVCSLLTELDYDDCWLVRGDAASSNWIKSFTSQRSQAWKSTRYTHMKDIYID